MDTGYGLSVGIIGDYLNGEDKPLLAALQRCASMSKDKCSLFNHGKDAIYIYRNASSIAEAESHIKACDDKIKTFFPGYDVDVFIPHQNSWGNFSMQALRN